MTTSSEPGDTPTHSYTHKRMLKTKKFIASKAAGTKLGRKVIISTLGEEGDMIFSALKDVVKEVSGKAKAKDVKQDILKLALKVKIMFEEKQLTYENTMHAEDSLLFVAQKFENALSGDSRETSVADLFANMSRLRDMLSQMLSPFLSESNLEKFRDLFLYLGSHEFLESLMFSDAVAAERNEIASLLRVLLKRAGC